MERNRLTLLLSLFLVLAGPAQAQTAPVQKLVFAASGAIPPAATVNAAFPNPIGSALGETCIVFAESGADGIRERSRRDLHRFRGV